MPEGATTKRRVPRSLEFAQFAIGFLWLLASRSGAGSAAAGISHVVGLDLVRPLLAQIFLIILLLTGYTALHWVATRNGSLRQTNLLPLRATMWREWQKGAAFGWGLLLIAVIPAAVVGDLHPQFWWTARAWGLALLSLATLFTGALATEMAFRGYLLQRLTRATGPVTATVISSLLFALLVTAPVSTVPFSFSIAFLSGVLFCAAMLRTQGLWLGWGLRFGWMASMAVLFGLPLAGSMDFASVVAMDTSGRTWLTGGPYGPEGAVFTALVLIAGVVALFAVTQEYAWAYTHEAIIPGAYATRVPPPPAHQAMEASGAPLLVQIGTPPPSVAPPLMRRAVDDGEGEAERPGY